MRKDTSEIISSICSSLSLNLTVFIKYSKVNNLENNRVISRKRYSQLVCLALGFISPNLLTLKDDEKIEAMQFTVHILNDAFRKYHSDFFEGIDLKPNDQDGYSQLNADICKWYAENCNNKSERKIVTTGRHLFYLQVGKGSISDQAYKDLKKDGTILSKNSDGNLVNLFNILFIEKRYDYKMSF